MAASRTGEVQFTITYDGPDLESGRMDAKDLAPAMLSMANLLEDSASVTYGPTVGIRMEVKSDFRTGSFSFDVVAASDQLSKAVFDPTVNIQTLLMFLGISGTGGLIGLVRWFRGRKLKSIEPTTNSSQNVQVTAEDGDSTIVNAKVVNLFQNSTVRFDLQGVVEPLEKEGITEFRTGRDRTEAVVRKEEVAFFEAPPPSGEILQDKVSEEIVELVAVSFRRANKWRFARPDGTIFSSHVDRTFMERVHKHLERFGEGDLLLVDLHVVVSREAGGLRGSYDIVKIKRRIPPVVQGNLFADPHRPQSLPNGDEPPPTRRLGPGDVDLE